MAETTIAEKYSQRGWYYALFFVFGALVGVGATALIVVPQTNALVAVSNARFDNLKHDFDSIMDLNSKLQDALKQTTETLGKMVARVKSDEAAMEDINKALDQSNRTLAIPNPIQRQTW